MEEKKSQLKVNLPKTNYLVDTLNYFLEEARSSFRISINVIVIDSSYRPVHNGRGIELGDSIYVDYRDYVDISVLFIDTYTDIVKVSTKLRYIFQEDLSLTTEKFNNQIDSAMYKNILRMFLIPDEVPKYPDLEDVFIKTKDKETFEYILKQNYHGYRKS